MTGSFALVTGLHWAAVLVYAAVTLLVTAGAFFGRERLERAGHGAAWLGVLLHAAGLAAWWRMVGHGPYVDRFEVLSSYAWVLVVGFALFARLFPGIRAAAMVVYPAAFSMVALGLFARPEIKQLPPTFRGIWLVLHIVFYDIAFCALVVALAFSVFFMLRARGRLAWLRALPELPAIDLHAHRFAGFGFVFWAIGMLAGSIWAYQSWNIFWNWDPVQTWSLLAWVLFGIYLHLRRFFGWQGERAARLFVACFLVVLFSLFVAPILEDSIHSGYFR
jgi:ABC-type transport system involved in cytochrome c biogenesis permease subunit